MYPKYFPKFEFHVILYGSQYSLGPQSTIAMETDGKEEAFCGVSGYGTPSFGTHQLCLVLQYGLE